MASPTTHTAAVMSGDRTPLLANHATTPPTTAQYSPSTTTNGTIATAPKYQLHDTRNA
jgi:hypothetical protein